MRLFETRIGSLSRVTTDGTDKKGRMAATKHKSRKADEHEIVDGKQFCTRLGRFYAGKFRIHRGDAEDAEKQQIQSI